MTDTDWKIEWATVYANAKDVAHAKREGTNLSIGDVVWRRATAVGPLTIEHNHWTGWVLDCDEADVLLAASAPRLKAENERLVQEVTRLRAENERLLKELATAWFERDAARYGLLEMHRERNEARDDNERLREVLQSLIEQKKIVNVREADGTYIDVTAWCKAALEQE